MLYEELEFEWDEEKARSNLQKHGVSFLTAAEVFDSKIIETVDDRLDYGEERLIAVGQTDGILYRVVYTFRGVRLIRIISAQKAYRDEREAYYRALYDESDQSDA